MNRFKSYIRKPSFLWIAGALIVAVLSVVDYVSAAEFDFSIFYLIPIGLFTLGFNALAGIVVAILGEAINVATDYLAGKTYTHPFYFYWNIIQDFAFYLIVVVILDRLKKLLSGLRQAHEEQVHLNSELKKAYELQNEFINIATHDLKNPLSGILGLSKKLTASCEREDVIAYGSAIHDASEHMFHLINSLLEANKYENRLVQLAPIELDLEGVTAHAISRLSRHAAAKEISIEHQAFGETVVVYADKRVIEGIVENLMSNAIKFSPRGKRIYIRIARKDRAVIWEIEDEGPGISEDDRKKLFRKFVRLSAQPTGGEHSTGLGLAIVKTLVELTNGKIRCESEPGSGAKFIVELPPCRPGGPVPQSSALGFPA